MSIQINNTTELKNLTALIAKKSNSKLSTVRNAFSKFYGYNEYNTLVANSFNKEVNSQDNEENTAESPQIGFNRGEFFIGDTIIPERLMQELNEISGFTIENREERVDDLIQWISESRFNQPNCSELMKDDLKILINSDDEFVIGNYGTNGFYTTENDLDGFINSANKILEEYNDFIDDAMSPEIVKEIIEKCNPDNFGTENEALEYAIQVLKDNNKDDMARALIIMCEDGGDDLIEALNWIVEIANDLKTNKFEENSSNAKNEIEKLNSDETYYNTKESEDNFNSICNIFTEYSYEESIKLFENYSSKATMTEILQYIIDNSKE